MLRLLPVPAAALLSMMVAVTNGGNPLVPNVGMADPHLRAVVQDDNETLFYLYATHDFANNNTGFRMKDWWAWTSPDMVHWRKAVHIAPNTSFLAWDPNVVECWATDAIVTDDGVWFWYLSVGPTAVGVVTSQNVRGPWKDPLGAPLLSPALGKTLTPVATFRDPGVFRDDGGDGAYYIVAGVFDYYIARLGDDIISLAERPRHITIDPNGHAAWGPYGNKTDDKPYLHERGGTYYLSWGCFYATSDSVYGPFSFQGHVIATPRIAPDFRMPHDPSQPWYAQQDLADRHGSFMVSDGQWFYASNDRSHSSDKAHPDVFRDTVVGYVHYRANGTIAPVVINAVGVGTYDAALGRIEAEDYFRREGAGVEKVDTTPEGSRDDAFAVRVPENGVLVYPLVRNATPRLQFRLHFTHRRPAAPPPVAASVRVTVGGVHVGECGLGSPNASGVVVCMPLALPTWNTDKEAAGMDVSFRFSGATVELDWFAFIQ